MAASSPATDKNAVLRVLDPGIGSWFQDSGRPGWRRFGVPPGGWIDSHAAGCANRLMENDNRAAVIEMLLQGARFEVLQPCWVALCGAGVEGSLTPWRAHRAQPGEVLALRGNRSGVWSYLAVQGGFKAPKWFGSASYYARGQIGRPLAPGDLLERNTAAPFFLPANVAGRTAHWEDQRDYENPPAIRVWPGPQWKCFNLPDLEKFLSSAWVVSRHSDRVGYRLEGPKLTAIPAEITSEPVRPGSIQVPEGGAPIITMPDGPTVGGYPKIALIHSEDLPWVVQSRPGQSIRFQLAP